MNEYMKEEQQSLGFEGGQPTVDDLANMLFPQQEQEKSAEFPESEDLNAEDAAEVSAAQESPQSLLDAQDVPLVRQFMAGDDKAFLKLYSKYEAPLLVYCRRMIPNRVAEDAFQEIWMKIFELRKRQIEIGNFRALLFRSARNLCLNLIRLEATRSGSSDALNTVLAHEESNVESEQKEIQVLLRRALGKLPFEQREAFVLHEYSGYSYAEIAEMMATTEVNIKVRAYRARIRLRKLIASWLRLAEDDDPANVI